MKNRYMFLFVFVMVVIGTDSVMGQSSNWTAPEYANSLINPFKGKENATAEGKVIFNQMCVICHGMQGLGNGEAGLSLERKPANFLALKVINETDGSIFWKLTEGKSPMASYNDLLREDQRWKLVNYIRVLEAKNEAVKKG